MVEETEEKVAVSENEIEPDTGSDEETDPARWYVLHTFAGQEQSIRDRIMEMAVEEGLQDVIRDVVVPTREVMEIKGNEKKQVEKQLYPGYIFIKMVMSEQNWHLVRQTRGVTGFVGTKLNPIPLENTEMRDVLAQIGEAGAEPEVEFSVGDTVRIIGGAMEEMTGTVKEVDIEKAKIRVSVDMFGRSTPVELNFDQAEKL
ncbi:MAG: transcription termination/antitermination protein NusG [bacterium]